MKAVIICFVALASTAAGLAQSTELLNSSNKIEAARLESEAYHVHRGNLNNSFTKFSRSKVGTVAFLGGSITYNGGWRDSIMNFLEAQFPATEFTFINAGIPSMGTTPAAFRLKRDVLSKGPIDLLFEEAAVNDDNNGRSAKEQIRAMEGIVRHLWISNSKTDIIMMHFVDPNKMTSYRNDKVPEVIENHNIVAQHYHLPVINLAKEVTDRIDNGEFTWEEDFINLHPSPFGQGIYAHSIITFLEKDYSEKDFDQIKVQSHPLPLPLDSNSYANGQLIDIEKASLGSTWAIDKNWTPKDGKAVRANYHEVPMLIDEGGGSSLKLRFDGRLIGIAVAAGPDAGIIEYRIDDGPWQTRDLFTKWSKNLHLPWYYTLESDLLDGSHLLELKVSTKTSEKSTGRSCRIRYFYTN